MFELQLVFSYSSTPSLIFCVSITFVAVLILSNRLNGKRRRVLSFVANNDSLAWWSWANDKPFLFNAKYINSHSSDSPLWLRIPSYYYVGFSNVIRNCKLVNKSRTQRNAEKKSIPSSFVSIVNINAATRLLINSNSTMSFFFLGSVLLRNANKLIRKKLHIFFRWHSIGLLSFEWSK